MTHKEAIQALTNTVHDEDGWLSDAQEAQLYVVGEYVFFCGEGSIDLGHLVSLVLGE